MNEQMEQDRFRMKQIRGKKKFKHLLISAQVEIMEMEKGRKCVICGTTQNLQVHHLCPRSKCNKDIRMNSWQNLIFCCPTCHNAIHSMKYPEYYHRKIDFKL